MERQRSDIQPTTHSSEAPLPPLIRRATVRTHRKTHLEIQCERKLIRILAGAGSRQPYQSPFEASVESRAADLDAAVSRSQSDRPPLPRHQTVGDVERGSPTQQEPSQRGAESRPENKRPSVYDPVYEVPPPPRRGSRSHLPPIETSSTTEAGEVPPAPPYAPLPPLRAGQPAPSTTHSQPSSRYVPYPSERPSYESGSRRRHSQTAPREYARPTSPHYNLRSPPRHPPTIYPQDPYPPYPPGQYARGTRRPSVGGYSEERRASRQESHRYQAPIPYGSYPHSYPYEYGGGRGYYEPYQGYLEYPPDRRLSQQEPGEQVTHLGVPERGYRPPMVGGPTSPSSIRVQPSPHAAGITTGTPGKRRGNLPKESKEKLKLWLSMHVDHPYPTEDEKKELAAEAGMTMGQVRPLIFVLFFSS